MKTSSALTEQTADDARTDSDLDNKGVHEIKGELRQLLADVFALYIKTKNFHWHMKGRHFRDYHLLLDEQADQIFNITDEIAERSRKLGVSTIRSLLRLPDTFSQLAFCPFRPAAVSTLSELGANHA